MEPISNARGAKKVAPAAAEEAEEEETENTVCYEWKRNRTCRFGDHCRYLHPEPAEKAAPVSDRATAAAAGPVPFWARGKK